MQVPTRILAKMKVLDLLAALPKNGKTKAAALMVDLDMPRHAASED